MIEQDVRCEVCGAEGTAWLTMVDPDAPVAVRLTHEDDGSHGLEATVRDSEE